MGASNGAEAPTALPNNAVDLILCDSNMRIMNGLECMRQMATVESAKGVPVVTMAGNDSEAHVVQTLSASVRGCILQPFTLHQVKERVLPLLGKKP